MILRRGCVGFLAGFAAIAISIPAFAGHVVLITPEEARLPPPRGPVLASQRGIARGPRVEYISENGEIHSPMHLRLKFESFGGARIDPDSLKVTYMRTPNVDLTIRVKPFVQPTGIDIPEVELPAGDHMVRVDIRDSDGRIGGTSFVLKVAP